MVSVILHWCTLLFDSAVMTSSFGYIFWFVVIMVNANLLWNVSVWVRVFEKRPLCDQMCFAHVLL